jgi:iron complex outermembrane receptor protein
MFKRTKVCTGVIAALGGTLLIGTMPAFAQSSERIEITGSRIRTVDSATAQPIQKVTAEEIQKSGLVTVGDVINALSSSGSPAFSKGAVLTSNREQGGQYADLRNLGAQRVLVLVNGKRWSQTVAGYTDMSTIPSALIDRIELLKDGASAIYGSDAIAGVVNVILKKSLEGGIFSAYVGQNEKGDGKTEDYSVAYGASGDKGSMLFGATYSKTDPVWARDRAITSYTYGPDHPVSNLGAGPYGRIRQVNAAGAASGFNLFLNHAGDYDNPGAGQDPTKPANYHTYAAAPADGYNSTRDMMFESGTKLASIFVKGNYELAKDIRLTSTAMFASRTSSRQIAGYPLNSLSQTGYPVYIDKDSYYNPYGNRVAGAGLGQDLFFYRRTIEVPRVTKNDNNTFHLDGAIEGDLNLGGMPWNWSVSGNYSKVSGNVTSTGNLNLVNLKKALGPSYLSAAGVVTCGTAAAPIGGCVPFNILGGPNASTPEALAYVMSVGQATYGSAVSSLNADVSGEVFKLPAGNIGVAAGLEQRKVRGYDRPGQFEQSGLSTDLAGNATLGNYTVNEFYAEVNVPLLKDLPFVDSLSIDLATRHSDYSTYGKTDRSKFSFQYRPIKDLLVRGTVAEGFRAPTLNDISGGGSQTFDTYLDPCDSVNGEAAKTPAVAARCAAAGVPAGFRQRNQAGTPVGTGGGQTVFPFQAGAGNATLQPETAMTKSFGLVFSPSFLPGLSGSVDFFDISIKNRITGVSSTYILNQCYIQGVAPFCTLLTRDATGTVNNLLRGNANLGELKTSGFDLALNYALPATSFGKFGIRTDSTYTTSYKVKSTATSNWVEYVGEAPYYRFKSNIGLDWSMGAFAATLGTRVYSKVRDQCWDSATECSNPGQSASWGTDVNMKGMLVYNDLSVAYTAPWKGVIRVGSNNVFNVKPRILYQAGSIGYASSSSSSVEPNLPIDRSFFVRYNQPF